MAGSGVSEFKWALNSSQIGYLADQDTVGEVELYTSSPNGAQNVKVSGDLVANGNVGSFLWSPLSTLLAYVADQDKRPILDIDYLDYEVFKKKYPRNISAVLNNKMTCQFAVTRVPEAKLVLLNPGEYDIYKTLKAAIAFPDCYPGTVKLGEFEYVDGGTVNPLPLDHLLRIETIINKSNNLSSRMPKQAIRMYQKRFFE